MTFLITILFCLTLQVFGEGENYCEEPYTSLCDGKPHIGCNAVKEYNEICPYDVHLYKSDEVKDIFLHFHNYYRNKFAAGEISGYDSAAKMFPLKWNDELAKLAEFNVLSCRFLHDKCRATLELHQAAQTLTSHVTLKGALIPEIPKLVNTSLSMWYDESQPFKVNFLKSFKNDDGTTNIQNFIKITLNRDVRVGCAMIRFSDHFDENYIAIHIACNYESDQKDNGSGYQVGKPASQCPEGPNSEFPALCSTDEATLK